MKRGIVTNCEKCLCCFQKKPIKIIGISSAKRSKYECAREDPMSLYYLQLALDAAKKAGAQTQLIDLRDLKIGACKECYSTNPAQCRFNEKTFQCDCYGFKEDQMFIRDTAVSFEKAYDVLSKKEFFENFNTDNYGHKDEMWRVYKALMEADGIIFSTFTEYYSRPALLQAMFSRLCALDGGVEELWGDGKNLNNSIKYSRNPKSKYKQRLYGKWCAFINCSKEGDSVTPDLMKACTMLGMKVLPLGVAYRVNWYRDPTHRSDVTDSKKDPYPLLRAKYIGKELVQTIKCSSRKYGVYSSIV